MDKYIRSTVERAEVAIRSRGYWIKVVGKLQQNWALIECESPACTVSPRSGDRWSLVKPWPSVGKPRHYALSRHQPYHYPRPTLLVGAGVTRGAG